MDGVRCGERRHRSAAPRRALTPSFRPASRWEPSGAPHTSPPTISVASAWTAPHRGPSRTLHNPDDHRRISDGRWSRYERQLDAVDPTDCAGTALRSCAGPAVVIARPPAGGAVPSGGVEAFKLESGHRWGVLPARAALPGVEDGRSRVVRVVRTVGWWVGVVIVGCRLAAEEGLFIGSVDCSGSREVTRLVGGARRSDGGGYLRLRDVTVKRSASRSLNCDF